jgi:hypothetical protein
MGRYGGMSVIDRTSGVICPATGEPHVFAEHDESPIGPRRVVHCVECDASPRDWPGEDAWAEALERDSVEVQGEQLPVPAPMPCPACDADGCAACAGEGWVEAVDAHDAALVVFRRAAAAALHPSGGLR